MQWLLILASLVAVGYCQGPVMCAGCPNQLSTNDVDSIALLQANVPTLPQGYTVENITTQVVSGINYRYVIKIGSMPSCEVVIWKQSWLNRVTVTKNTCPQPVSRRRQLMGGWSTVLDKTEPLFQQALHCVLDRVNAMSNNMYKMVALNAVVPPTQQVVAGMQYNITYRVGESTCMQSVSGYASCPANTNSVMQPMIVAAKVWMKPGGGCDINDFKLTRPEDPTSDNLIGGDTHDYVDHGKQTSNNIGGDDHDYKSHGSNNIGGDDHDYKSHGSNNIGGDNHDYMKHGGNMMGGDNHDYMKHGGNMMGGDKHDYMKHGRNLMGSDNNVDNDPTDGNELLNSDEDDFKQLIGGDGHDDCHGGMFLDFVSRHNKQYINEKEKMMRYITFCENMKRVKKFQLTEKGTARYGATKFADLTEEEFKQYVGKTWDQSANDWMKKADIPKGPIPKSFDWREHGAVTPVKNQGSCGSCWAFSTTGNIEGQWAVMKKKLVSLSEQELVDCDKLDDGCEGGLPSNAYKEIERLGGMETEADYQYKGEDEKCEFVKREVKVYINDSVSISSNEIEMAAWLAAHGPISIGINAFAMQFYMGGISYPWKIFCNPKSLDHGVLIVGYDVEKGSNKPYWIVKNSWGPDWGEKGYYLVYRGAGVCGLNTMCTSSVIN